MRIIAAFEGKIEHIETDLWWVYFHLHIVLLFRFCENIRAQFYLVDANEPYPIRNICIGSQSAVLQIGLL